MSGAKLPKDKSNLYAFTPLREIILRFSFGHALDCSRRLHRFTFIDHNQRAKRCCVGECEATKTHNGLIPQHRLILPDKNPCLPNSPPRTIGYRRF